MSGFVKPTVRKMGQATSIFMLITVLAISVVPCCATSDRGTGIQVDTRPIGRTIRVNMIVGDSTEGVGRLELFSGDGHIVSVLDSLGQGYGLYSRLGIMLTSALAHKNVEFMEIGLQEESATLIINAYIGNYQFGSLVNIQSDVTVDFEARDVRENVRR